MTTKKKSMAQLGIELADEHISRNTLDHDETLRGTALSLACRYYVETIVKDGDLYREMVRDNRVLKPATYCGVIEVALAFEAFIKGEIKSTHDAITETELEEVTENDRVTPSPEVEL
jgi:hypothetical protein